MRRPAKSELNMLDNTFGKYEMEVAALIFVRKANKLKIPLMETRVDVSRRLSKMEKVGICLLAGWGWIKPSYPNNEFVPTQEMIVRIAERHPECLKYGRIGRQDPLQAVRH